MFAFGKKPAAPAPKLPERRAVPYRPGTSLEYWRQRDDLVTFARNLLRDPNFQDMLAVLHHELPLQSTIEAVIAHKRVLRMIELMAEHSQKQTEEIESTFGAEQEPTNEPQQEE